MVTPAVVVVMVTIIMGSSVLLAYTQARAIAQPLQNNTNINGNLSLRTLIQQRAPLVGFAKETEPLINQTYIQTGKVDMVFKHFTIYGRDSITAATASQCTNDQGKFWNFYDVLYNNQGVVNSGWANRDNLKKFASQIPGLDTQKFNSCLDSGKYISLIQNDLAFATSLGFQGTPTFIIEKSDGSNPEMLPGAYPFPSFKAIIDKELGGG